MPDIDRTSGVPAYRQIADEIRAAIRSGTILVEEALPSENDLTARYGVARATVRAAIDLLEKEGLVETHHGRGTFVRRWEPWEYEPARHLTKRGDEPRATWRTEGERQGRDTVMEVLGISVVDDPDDFVEALLGAPLVSRRKREWVDGVPIALYESWFGPGTTSGTALEEMEPVPHGMLDYIEEQIGLPIVGFEEHLSVRNPTPEEASALELGPGVPVLVVRSVTHTTDDVPLHVDVKVIAGNAVSMIYRLPGHEA